MNIGKETSDVSEVIVGETTYFLGDMLLLAYLASQVVA